MNRRLAVAGISGLLVASMSLSACGQRSAEPSASGPGGSSEKVVKIALIAPLSGGLSAFGAGMRNSLDLAVKQANETDAVPGWEIQFVAEDDQGSPDAGKNAATKLTGDPEVIGVVGPLNSSVGQAIQPIFQSAGVALVSPANTNPTLTKGADLNNPTRPYSTYFRTCTTDAIQGPFAAKYLLDSGVTEVATIHDKKAYGQGLVTAFSEAFTAGGGTVVAAETINPDDKDFSAVVTNVKDAGPQAVYYGGEYPQSGPLSQQMKGAGLSVPLMGGDGMYDPAFIELAGSTSEGDLVTSVGAPTETLASAQSFVEAYRAEGYQEGWAAYGMYTYDAGNAIIAALKTSLANATDVPSAKAATVEALAKVDFEGASGRVAFDEFGDSKARVLTVYRVEGGAWKPAKTEDFQ